jgi:hypothetical protein
MRSFFESLQWEGEEGRRLNRYVEGAQGPFLVQITGIGVNRRGSGPIGLNRSNEYCFAWPIKAMQPKFRQIQPDST